ncbi:MAG: hypothetical protein AB1531_11545 [Chloroflexota bacterium]
MRRFFSLLFLSCLLLTALGCQPSINRRAWAVTDLRLLDPLDAPSPSTDLLAVYVRSRGADLEIRLDLLDLPLVPDYDLTLRLLTPTGEITLLLPAKGRPSVIPAESGLRARLVRDPRLDTVTVRLNRLYISQPFSLQAAAYLPGQTTPADETPLVRSDALPPAPRAPALIAFWDVYPAVTPAQALRRWDGAHTGPNGGRHGLKHILDSVETYQRPVALLDLKTPASLAALDFMSALPQVKRLAAQGLLLLPEAAWSQPADMALELSRDAAEGFGLPGSPFVYASGSDPSIGLRRAQPVDSGQRLQPAYRYQFLSLPDASRLARSGMTRLVPLPTTEPAQATSDGPSLEVRRALVEALFSPDETDLVALGGSLPDSTWGVPDMADATFAWLAGHPWVWVLDGYDLMTFPVGGEYNPPALAVSGADPWLEALRRAPDNPITQSAWQTYLTLHAPSDDATLQSLRDAYAGQIGVLLAAAEWAESPSSLADCSRDPDLDGRSECVLANERYFAVIETNGARLSHLFFLDKNGAHQLVAPASQFAVGLSDPSEWRPERGEAADPRLVMGAFSDTTGMFDEFRAESGEAEIRLTGAGRTKIFRLGENGLGVRYQADGPLSTLIPLAVEPRAFYFAPSNYLADLSPSSWTWGPQGGIRAEVRTEADLLAYGFTTLQVYMDSPEDPDLEYPAEHYFPFPFALVTVHAEGEFAVWIEGK